MKIKINNYYKKKKQKNNLYIFCLCPFEGYMVASTTYLSTNPVERLVPIPQRHVPSATHFFNLCENHRKTKQQWLIHYPFLQ